MFENSPIAVRIVSKRTCKVIFANQNYCNLIEGTMEDALETNPRTFFVDQVEYDDTLSQIDRGNNVINKLLRLAIANKIKWVLASFMPLKFKNEESILAWLYDITDRKNNEDEDHYHALFD